MKIIDSHYGAADSMEEINGVQVYRGGQPGTALIRGKFTARVACIACKHLVEDTDAYYCNKVVDDNGNYLQLEGDTRKTTRCQEWHPNKRFAVLGKNLGEVQSPQFVKWKLENKSILTSPSAFGYDGKDMHRFLEAKFREKNKHTPTTLF